jgi:hypothetical protein
MDTLLLTLGRLAGLAGAVIFIVAVGARLMGVYWLAGFQAGTMLLAAVAVMVLGCFLLLLALVGRAGVGKI